MTEEGDVPIRPAATVVVLRDGPGGLEVLTVQRHSRMVFHGGAWVFPGGRVDEADGHAGGTRPSIESARNAATRELSEEAGLVVDPDELVPFARWITPPNRPRRFDTLFFATRAPSAEVRVDEDEIVAAAWRRPDAALADEAAGLITLPRPTTATMMRLGIWDTAAAALAGLADHGVEDFGWQPLPSGGTDSTGQGIAFREDIFVVTGDPDSPGPRHRMVMFDNGRGTYERSGLPDRVRAPALLEVAQAWWDVDRVPYVTWTPDARRFDLVEHHDPDTRLLLLTLTDPAPAPRELAEVLAEGLASCDFPPTGDGASPRHVAATLRAAGLGHLLES